ncbi:MAG TPA: DUF2304 domain-containing protein [Chitinophagales bacterium]
MQKVQLISILFSFAFLGYVFWQIKKGKLREEYAFVWIVSTIALTIFSVWSDGLFGLAGLLGVEVPLNLLFAGAIFVILIYLLHLSLAVSKLQAQNKQLAQELALLKEKFEKNAK